MHLGIVENYLPLKEGDLMRYGLLLQVHIVMVGNGEA